MIRRLLVLLLIFFTVLAGPGSAGAYDRDTGIEAVYEVMEYIRGNHLSGPELDQLVEGAIWGMIQTLGDPYTEFMSREELEQFKMSIDGSYTGIGVYLDTQPDYPRVMEVFKGSPADRGGILAGDLIKNVDGIDVRSWPLPHIVDRITGPAGSEVTITVLRDGSEFTFGLVREALSISTVRARKVGKNTGYIAVSSFGEKTAADFRSALTDLRSQGIEGLVIDLKGNGGGYLQAAVEVAESFLPPGALVLSAIDSKGDKEELRTGKQAAAIGIPVVLLLDEYSASASEVLAGALQDHGAAVLVGQTSYGKGVVQSVVELDYGGVLKLTTAEYITPKSRHLNNRGLTPDHEVLTGDLQLPFALHILEPGEITVKFAIGSGEAMVDNERINCGEKPVQIQNGVYLPLRFVMEALGYNVAWDGEAGKITVKGKGKELVLGLNDRFVLLNGQKMITTLPAAILRGDYSFVSVDVIRMMSYEINRTGDAVEIKG